MELPADVQLKLETREEYMHPPTAAENYNERMYFNRYDAGQGVGGWFRVGDREWRVDGPGLRAWARTDRAEYRIEGRVLSLIPLRNRRTLADGTELVTRIAEGLTEYRCNGRVGYGLSEYLDQTVAGRPLGVDA